MTDFLSQNDGSYQQPLNGPTPYQPSNYPPQNTAAGYSSSIPVNQTSITNAHYKTPFNFLVVFICAILFVIGIFYSIFIIALSKGNIKEILFGFIPLILPLAGVIVGSCMFLYYSINIDSSLRIITIRKVKLFFCFSTKKVIEINHIKQVIVQTDYSTNCFIKGEHYNAFDVIFKLVDGNEVIGCTKIINKNGEGRKAFNIIRNALPNIGFGGDLTY